MTTLLQNLPKSRNRRRAASALDAERARVRALPAVRYLAGRFAMPMATALLTAESFGLHTGADR